MGAMLQMPDPMSCIVGVWSSIRILQDKKKKKESYGTPHMRSIVGSNVIVQHMTNTLMSIKISKMSTMNF